MGVRHSVTVNGNEIARQITEKLEAVLKLPMAEIPAILREQTEKMNETLLFGMNGALNKVTEIRLFLQSAGQILLPFIVFFLVSISLYLLACTLQKLRKQPDRQVVIFILPAEKSGVETIAGNDWKLIKEVERRFIDSN